MRRTAASGIELAALEQRVEQRAQPGSSSHAGLQAARGARGGEREDLALQVRRAGAPRRPVLAEPRAVRVDLLPRARGCPRPRPRRSRPRAAASVALAERERRGAARARSEPAAGWSALLITITSGISMTPALSAWIESPEPGMQHERDGVGQRRDLDLGLPHADRLEDHDVLAAGVQHQPGLQRGLGDAAEVAAGAHRADEDAGVEEVVGQPDAVAEQRALRERAGGVDRDHADASGRARAGARPARRRGSTCRRRAGPVMPSVIARPVCG